MADDKAIPLYENGSRGLTILAFEIGLMIPLPRSVGIVPVLKQTLYNICRHETEHLFFRISSQIESMPTRFARFCFTNSFFYFYNRNIFI